MKERGSHSRVKQNIEHDMSDEFHLVSSRQKPSIREKSIDFSKAVSLIGIRHAVDQKNSKIRKSIWIFWILFGCGLALYQIQERITYYYSYPVNTEVKEVDAVELLLPQVTICNHFNPSDVEKWEYGIDTVPGANATFAGDTLQEEWLNTDLGKCLVYSTATRKLVSRGRGLEAGLEIKWGYGYFSDHKRLKLIQGFRILLDDQSDVVLMNDNSFPVRLGSVVQILLSMENITQLGPPYGDCNDDPDYSSTKCIARWEQKIITKEIRCRHDYVEEVCRLRADPGPCNNYVEKWFYDSFNHKCRRFSYGGCRGNDNRFNSEDECISACKDILDVCLMPEDPGLCESNYTEKWLYDSVNRTCRRFRDCGRNSIYIDREDICLEHCRDLPDSCRIPEDDGSCKEDLRQAYFYDPFNQTCRLFSFRDCDRKLLYAPSEKMCLFICRIVREIYTNCRRSNYGKSFRKLATQDRSSVLSLCPPQCHRRIYKYSVIYSKTFDESREEEGDRTRFKPTLLYINYDHLLYTDIRSFPAYSFLSLLCDVGGALSMLLGATLLTIYEVGEFLFLIACDYVYSKRKTCRLSS